VTDIPSEPSEHNKPLPNQPQTVSEPPDIPVIPSTAKDAPS
jgi:hypothetical protein